MELRNLDLDLGLNKQNTACWTYRGEGNANLILALDGQNKVLRLKKTLKPDKISLNLKLNHSDNIKSHKLAEGDCCDSQVTNNISCAEECSMQSNGMLKDSSFKSDYLDGTTIGCKHKNSDNELSRSILERCIWETRWWKTFTKLLGTCYTIRDNEKIEIVDLTSCDLSKLNELLECLRPPSRRHKLVASEYAVMFPDFTLMPDTDDLCYGDTFTFELKPKHGWTPYVIHVNESTEYAKCPYCLTQFLKYKKGKINKISGYCPLDLFSGNLERMNKALRCIIEVPQNNFKIFRNGHAIEHSDLSKLLRDLFNNEARRSNSNQMIGDNVQNIEKQFMNNYESSIEGANSKNNTSRNCDIHESQLFSNKKLKLYHPNEKVEVESSEKYCVSSNSTNPAISSDILKELAKMIAFALLKPFNTLEENLSEPYLINKQIHYDNTKSKYLKKLKDFGLKTCYKNPVFNILPKGCILERLLRLQLLDCDVILQNLSKGSGYEYIEGTLKVLEDSQGSLNNLTDLERSMMAATVKDCSIMLTFRRIKDSYHNSCHDINSSTNRSNCNGSNQYTQENNHIVEMNNQKFMARVSVIDLDLKPESRIDNYLKHIHDMFEASLEYLTKQKSDS